MTTYSPSEKQVQALANMETFAWIWSHRTNFATPSEFQEYFSKVQNKAWKVAKTRKAIAEWKISKEDIEGSIRKKKETYYSQEWTLRQYALEYLNRYFPSKLQLREKLTQKVQDKDLALRVLASVEWLIDEEKMVKSLVDQLLQRGKNIWYISDKLYRKKFDWLLIKRYIDDLKWWDTLLKEYTLEEKVRYYKEKGKSKNHIFMKFYERGQDRSILNQVLEKVFWEDWETDGIQKEIERLVKKWVPLKEMTNKLLAKWFPYRLVKDSISQQKDS